MAISTIGNMQLDELFASVKNDVHTRTVLIKGTTALKRGQLIGSDGTANGAYSSTNKTVVGILCKDVTPTSNGVKAEVYVSGHFNGNKVIGYTATIDADLRDMGIFVDKAMTY